MVTIHSKQLYFNAILHLHLMQTVSDASIIFLLCKNTKHLITSVILLYYIQIYIYYQSQILKTPGYIQPCI